MRGKGIVFGLLTLAGVGVAGAAMASGQSAAKARRRRGLSAAERADLARLDAGLRAMGLDPSRLDASERRVLADGLTELRAWITMHSTDPEGLPPIDPADVPRWVAATRVFMANYTREELRAAFRRGGHSDEAIDHAFALSDEWFNR